MLKAFTYDILEGRPYNDTTKPSNVTHPHLEGSISRAQPQCSNPYNSNTHNSNRSRSPYGSTH